MKAWGGGLCRLPASKRGGLTTKEDAPQHSLRYGLVFPGHPVGELMHVAVLHELKRQHCLVAVDGRPRISQRLEGVAHEPRVRYDFSPPGERLDDMAGPFKELGKWR